MSQVEAETFKIEAVNKVLGTLGDSMFAILKYNLMHDYNIALDDDLFTLEELHVALQSVFGTDGSNLIMREIHNEIARLKACAT